MSLFNIKRSLNIDNKSLDNEVLCDIKLSFPSYLKAEQHQIVVTRQLLIELIEEYEKALLSFSIQELDVEIIMLKDNN
jgi:hypothetical protein